MSEYLAVGLCLILASAYVGWVAGLIYGLKKAERDDMQARDKWAAEYQRRTGVM